MKRICIIITILLLNISFIQAQVITSVPPTTGNDRFLDEIYSSMKRPGLSVVGFDNGGDNSKGYGLKQILNQVYVTGSNEQKDLFGDIIDYSIFNTIIPNPSTEKESRDNSNILQYRAFEALASYILEQNGIDSTTSSQTYGITIREHETALNSFTSNIMALINRNNGTGSLAAPFGDYVANTGTYGNIARAMDLYLALENAYKHYDYTEWNNPNSTKLLNSAEKEALNLRFITNVYGLQQEVQKNHGLGINEDEVEPGNRPLKGYMTMGYGAMATQKDSYNDWQIIDGYPSLARTRGSASTSSDRMKKWMFQTDNGERFWAEGAFYFNFALMDVVPFWHATRANNMLNGVIDPFDNDWFTKPVEWLADVSTPDGTAPALDDGNKYQLHSSVFLRWNNSYGSESIGKKFNAIYNTIKNYNHFLGTNTWLMELAIPKATTSTPIDYSIKDSVEQQVIHRYNDSSGQNHYLLLNGEYGKAITRGEGHEQPDQMQLLYYIDGTTFLMDLGYDSAPTFGNSTWNGYKNHNVMNFVSTTEGGGLSPPYVDYSEKRKVSDHNPANINYTNHGNNITELSGSVTLGVFDLGVNGYYDRNVLFIKGDKPYVIDFNSLNTSVYDYQRFNNNIGNYGTNFHEGIFYHGFSDTFASNGQWKYWDIFGSNKNLYMYLKPVEVGNVSISNQLVSSMEAYDDDKDIRRATLLYPYAIPNLAGYYERDLTTMAILVADDVSQPDPEPIYTYQNDIGRPHQGWAWSPGNDIVDVIAKRSKSDTQIYDDTLTFNVEYQSEFIAYLSLPANKDYGFARLEKVNGEWVIDNQYALNINQEEPIPSTPTNLVISNLGSPGNPDLEWDWTNFTNIDLDYFEVYRKKKRLSDDYVFPLELLGTTTNETFTDVSVFMDQITQHPYDYQYTVAAVSMEDKSSPYSNYTNWINGLTQHKAAPEQENEPMPESFGLAQNYPNPFNPTTQIKFDLPEEAEVSIRIYNIMGQVVANLVYAHIKAGFHEISFDAGNLASGMYIAKMNATGTSGDVFTKEIKMQLIK